METPLFEHPLPTQISCIVIQYCFQPMGIIIGINTTTQYGWNQPCIRCAEPIDSDTHFAVMRHGYIHDECVNWLSSLPSCWVPWVNIGGIIIYASCINTRKQRRKLNPRRRQKHREAMMCPVTKLLRELGVYNQVSYIKSQINIDKDLGSYNNDSDDLMGDLMDRWMDDYWNDYWDSMMG